MMGGLSEEIFVYYFHKLSEVHDGDAGAQIMYDLKVMGNKEIGKIEFVLEVEKEIDYLGLYGDVQGRDRFVRHDEFRMQG